MGAVGLLTGDPACLSHAARIDVVVGLERQLARLQAQQLRVLGVMVADPAVPDLLAQLPGEDPADPRSRAVAADWVREDVACALRLSPASASARLALADDLRRLPAMLDLFEAGAVSLRHVTILGEAVRPLDDAQAAVVEAAVLDRAAGLTPAAFRRCVTRAVLRVDGRGHQAAGLLPAAARRDG